MNISSKTSIESWKKIHLWISLVLAPQFLIWSITGVGITLIGNENLSGASTSRGVAPPPVVLKDVRISPSKIDLKGVKSIELIGRAPENIPVYRIAVAGVADPVIVDARHGKFMAPISADEAATLAMADYIGDGSVSSVDWISEKSQVGKDYYGEYPTYRVNFIDGQATRLYVSPFIGQITVRRNVSKTIFDGFYDLHLFRYIERELYLSVPVILSGVLALFSIASGFILFWRR